jgi:Cd2+/Zn2+-exporting ATPase
MASSAPAASEPAAPEAGAAAERFRVEGMDCASCARTVEKAVAAIDGVRAATVSFGNAMLAVDGDVTAETVQAVVSRAGYRARPVGRRRERHAPFWRRDLRTVSTLVSVVVLAAAVVASLWGAPRAVTEPLYLASMAVGGWAIARAALAALQRRSLDMNALMSLAAVGAVGIGEYAEGAWVLVLFAVGTTLESYAFDRSRRSVTELMDLAPEQARVISGDGDEHLMPVEEVTVGARFVVRPGERIPLDGVVVSGASSVDEAPITGESVPVDKQPGAAVFAGTLNAQGALTVRATKTASDSTLARVAELVEQAQGSRAPSERFVDRFARIYTPLVFGAALAFIGIPVGLLGGDLDTWLYRALALLIVACPCSLVISIPVAVVSAVGRAAREGVLIKGGQALEDLARVKTLAIDKTGTLTRGLPQLADIAVLDGAGKDQALALVAAVERRSEHPLAEALVRAARERRLAISEPDAFEALPGRGVIASVDGRKLWAGGPRLAAEHLGGVPEQAGRLHARGQTAIILGDGARALAVFGLADQPRPEAADALAKVRQAGIGGVIMLTGDNERVAAAVAAQVGADDYQAGLLPEDKLRAVEALNAERGPVAMVGDGINDAPALAAAPVGIAMGAAGTDAALQSADVALMSDDLARLPDAVTGARQASRVMRQNVVASLLVKAVFVALAPLGMVTLVLAVAADMGMSLLVTLNGLRLLRRRRSAGDHAGGTAAGASKTDTCQEDCCTHA